VTEYESIIAHEILHGWCLCAVCILGCFSRWGIAALTHIWTADLDHWTVSSFLWQLTMGAQPMYFWTRYMLESTTDSVGLPSDLICWSAKSVLQENGKNNLKECWC